MAKRFGRNQRRRMIAEQQESRIMLRLAVNMAQRKKIIIDGLIIQLAETGNALNAERGSVFRVATGEELWVIPEANVRRYTDTSEYHRHDGQQHDIQRTCDVQLIQFTQTEALMDALARRYGEQELVSFRGLRWAIQDLRADRPDRSFDVWNSPSFVEAMTFTVKLSAVGKAMR